LVTSAVPVRAPKVAELVAARLRWQILAGELADGSDLPRESDLIEAFDVSRPSLREALRILETEGLVRVRRGSVGGAVVRRPGAASAGYHLGLTLQAHSVTNDDLAVARLTIEPSCAALTAELPDRSTVVAELTELVDESEKADNTADFTELAQRFHLRLIELCGNTTMVIVAGTLEAVWGSQETRVLTVDGSREDPKTRARSIAAHRRLIAAIADGAGERARREMRKHLADTQQLMIGTRGSTVIELAPPPTPGRSALGLV
jgi:GntR family transcriptional regulator, transcriptional repressor for pyruvate dehydrogenase complex